MAILNYFMNLIYIEEAVGRETKFETVEIKYELYDILMKKVKTSGWLYLFKK